MTRSTYIISDLHMGDGSPRDNFAVDDKAGQLVLLAEMIAAEQGELIILGDLFEFWQASLGRVLVERKSLLDALVKTRPVYVVGNHDIDLEALIGTQFLAHPFFDRMTRCFSREIGGRQFHFLHGHEVDEYNKGYTPGKGRALTILAGLAEDAIGSPFLDKEKRESVEARLTWLGEKLLWVWDICAQGFTREWGRTEMANQKPTPRQKPSLLDEHLLAMKQYREKGKHDLVICGHTHVLGTFEDWYFNSGGWAERTNDVLRLDADGVISYHDFKDGQLVEKSVVPVLTTA